MWQSIIFTANRVFKAEYVGIFFRCSRLYSHLKHPDRIRAQHPEAKVKHNSERPELLLADAWSDKHIARFSNEQILDDFGICEGCGYHPLECDCDPFISE